MGRIVRIANGFNPRPAQLEVWNNLKRFNVLLAHRRFGKTVFAVNLLVRQALECKHPRPRTHYFAPDYSQAKRVAWDAIKACTDAIPGRAYNESELRVDIPPDRRIQLGSAEVGDRNRGIYSDGIVLDEPAQMSTYFVTSVIRPALSDRAGSLLAIGTPQARFGAFFDLWELSATEPDWWRGKYTVEDTQLINAAELRSAKRLMGNNAYLSEYMCVWGVSVRGAFYAEVMEAIDKAGQIGRVRHAEQHLVHTCWDLGVTDSTAIFAFQAVGGEYNFLKHWEFTNRSYADIVGVLKDYATEQRWQYGKAIVPHDAKNKSQITGHSRRRTLEKLGLNTVVAPNRGIMDGIDLLRSRLRNCNFDSEGCRLGLEALRQYQSEWVDEKGVMKTQPLHNWASHSADSMRYFAVTPNSRLTSKTGRDKEYAADYY